MSEEVSDVVDPSVFAGSIFREMSAREVIRIFMVCFLELPKRQLEACGECPRVTRFDGEDDLEYTVDLDGEAVTGVHFDVCANRIYACWVGLDRWDALVERSGTVR